MLESLALLVKVSNILGRTERGILKKNRSATAKKLRLSVFKTFVNEDYCNLLISEFYIEVHLYLNIYIITRSQTV